MASYPIQEIQKMIQAQTPAVLFPATIEHLLTDSRQLQHPEKTLFFALSGRQDGHRYIQELIDKGVRNFVVKEGYAKVVPNVNFLVVEDTLCALQDLSAWHREQFSYPVIGITGSNGKTIVKEWLYQLLSPDYVIVRSPKSYNSQIGVPLSVWEMSAGDTLGIFEAGISQPKEMERLLHVIRPTIGVLTNIGEAHDEGFLNTEQKLWEKSKLFATSWVVIAPQELALQNTEVATWSLSHPEADLFVQEVEPNGAGGTHIKAIYRQQAICIAIPFRDSASIANAITCWRLMLELNYNPEVISERMNRLHSVAMRLELKQAINQCSLINDSYSSDIPSLSIALDFLASQHQHTKRTVVLSDLHQSGRSSEELYRQVAKLLKSKSVDRFIGIGPDLSAHQHLFNSASQFYPDIQSFILDMQGEYFRNEAILLKGARVFAFEKIAAQLELKIHDTVLEVNLNALVHNLNYYRSLLQPSTRIMCMVKAFSYGSGSYEIANLLEYHRADYLAVAYVDEGVALRKAGISLPILVMSPEESGFEALLTYRLEPELYNFRILDAFCGYLKNLGRELYPVHIKLDTGMNRLGFSTDMIPELLERLGSGSLKIQSVFSHLAGSEDSSLDAFTQQQLATFQSMNKEIAAVVRYPYIQHIANTAGIARFPEAQLDMVRLGIGLYGIPVAGSEKLQQVARLRTTVTQLKKILNGDTVGYGRRGRLKEGSTIATVKIGYADGLFRAAGNGNYSMLVNGQLAPTVGSICMDMCMLDVTGLEVREGDEVIVFGEKPSIYALSEAVGTIPYEILTSVSQRVKRAYFYE